MGPKSGINDTNELHTLFSKINLYGQKRKGSELGVEAEADRIVAQAFDAAQLEGAPISQAKIKKLDDRMRESRAESEGYNQLKAEGFPAVSAKFFTALVMGLQQVMGFTDQQMYHKINKRAYELYGDQLIAKRATPEGLASLATTTPRVGSNEYALTKIILGLMQEGAEIPNKLKQYFAEHPCQSPTAELVKMGQKYISENQDKLPPTTVSMMNFSIEKTHKKLKEIGSAPETPRK